MHPSAAFCTCTYLQLKLAVLIDVRTGNLSRAIIIADQGSERSPAGQDRDTPALPLALASAQLLSTIQLLLTATQARCASWQGIAGHGFYDTCVVPIIENTARECELTDRLREAIAAYPRANAVLVRRHGIYVWGSNWLQVRRLGSVPAPLL